MNENLKNLIDAVEPEIEDKLPEGIAREGASKAKEFVDGGGDTSNIGSVLEGLMGGGNKQDDSQQSDSQQN